MKEISLRAVALFKTFFDAAIIQRGTRKCYLCVVWIALQK